jgi:hypothetical protein
LFTVTRAIRSLKARLVSLFRTHEAASNRKVWLMQIAIADTTGKVSLWCSVNSINEDGSIDFDVINGAWRGRYNNGKVFIEYTKATIPGFLVWVGSRGGDYNAVIPQIQEEIDNPEYVMTQPNLYVEPAREPEDEWDDVPF